MLATQDRQCRAVIRAALPRRARVHQHCRSVLVYCPDQLPSQVVGHVCSEDSLEHVQLVDHHVPESRQEPWPSLMVRKYSQMKHLGIG